MDCRASLSMNSSVIANEVKQSMQSEVMDRHASLAMTVHGPSAASGRYGGLAMTGFFCLD
jgi:hypothetical protein